MTISGIGTPKVVLKNISADYPKERFERLEQDNEESTRELGAGEGEERI